MKWTSWIVGTCLFCSPLAADETAPPDLIKLSEAFGNMVGRQIKASGIDFNTDSFVKGVRDGIDGKPSPLNEKDFEKQLIQLNEQATKKIATDNLKKADDFMAKNKSESGVKELEPGKLQILVLSDGTGEAIPEHGTPEIKYTGKYIDGTPFSSSEEAGGTIVIPVDQTIPGFGKGLVGAKEGEKRRIFVHPDLGYGTFGQLAPNALLIFDVEIVKASAPLQDNEDDRDDDSDEDDDHDEKS